MGFLEAKSDFEVLTGSRSAVSRRDLEWNLYVPYQARGLFESFGQGKKLITPKCFVGARAQ